MCVVRERDTHTRIERQTEREKQTEMERGRQTETETSRLALKSPVSGLVRSLNEWVTGRGWVVGWVEISACSLSGFIKGGDKSVSTLTCQKGEVGIGSERRVSGVEEDSACCLSQAVLYLRVIFVYHAGTKCGGDVIRLFFF